MTVYMPPIDRKKKVASRYAPDTFRVISDEAENLHPKFQPQPYKANFEPNTPVERLLPDIDCPNTKVFAKAFPDFRNNNPHPKLCGFINTNVHLLNEPICVVNNIATVGEETKWWPTRANKGTLHKPEHTLDTLYRNDFMYSKDKVPPPSYRYSAHPNKESPNGIVPVNFLHARDGNQRFYQESKSFEHIYNSRADPNYPIRGKRQGAFVWNQMDPESTKRFIEHHKKLNEESPPIESYDSPEPTPLQQSPPQPASLSPSEHKEVMTVPFYSPPQPVSSLSEHKEVMTVPFYSPPQPVSSLSEHKVDMNTSIQVSTVAK